MIKLKLNIIYNSYRYIL